MSKSSILTYVYLYKVHFIQFNQLIWACLLCCVFLMGHEITNTVWPSCVSFWIQTFHARIPFSVALQYFSWNHFPFRMKYQMIYCRIYEYRITDNQKKTMKMLEIFGIGLVWPRSFSSFRLYPIRQIRKTSRLIWFNMYSIVENFTISCG